jgi:hypothetical protein
MKYIYLDSRFWIDIGDNIISNNNKEVGHFYYMLKELVHSKKAICPVSNPLFLELFKQTDEKQMKTIAKVMDELSCGLMIESKYYLFQREIKNTFSKDASIWVDIKKMRDLYEQTIKIPEKLKEDIKEENRNPRIEEIIDVVDIADWDKFHKLIETMNKYLQDEKIRHESEITKFKELQVIEILNTFKTICDIFPSIKHEINQLSSLPDLTDIYYKLPSIWAFGSIHALLRYDRNRKYWINDYFDIDHCAIAIGYYDYLFTERTFYHIVTNSLAELDNLFGVKCCKNYEEANLLLYNLIIDV